MTQGSPARALVLFSLPIAAGEFFYLFYSMADAIIVGRTLGSHALAAVGCVTPPLYMVNGIAIGLSGGFTIVLAQRFGAGKAAAVKRGFLASMVLAAAAALVVTAVLVPSVQAIVALLNTPADIAAAAAAYLSLMAAGFPCFMFACLLSSSIRALGDSRTPFLIGAAASLLNIALDYIFILVCGWGVRGAAGATVIAWAVQALLAAGVIARRYPLLRPGRDTALALPGFIAGEAAAQLPLGLSMAVQRCIVEAGNILVQRGMNGLGTSAVAAVAAGIRVRQLNMLPFFSLSQAAATFTAQNWGAGKIGRIYRGLRQALLIAAGVGAVMAAVNFTLGRAMAGVFLKDAPVSAAMTAEYLRYIGASVFLLGFMLIFRDCMQALGKKSAPTLCSVMETAMSAVTAFVLIPRFGFSGLCLANPLSWLASGLPVYIGFVSFARRQKSS